jgi:3-oxoadipate enol-lactonase
LTGSREGDKLTAGTPMKTKINGIELAYTDQGPDMGPTGLPIVLLHAFPLNKKMWEPQIQALADRFRVITLDLRGHGESEAPLWRYTMEQFAADVNGLLDHLSIRQAVLAGLSMGGYILFAFYRQYADRVKALVLADTRAGADTPEGKAGRYSMAQAAYKEGVKTVEDAMLPRLLSPAALQEQPALVEEVRAIIRMTPVSGIVGDLIAMSDRPDSIPLLPEIRCPTLVIVGDQDQATPPAEAKLMAERIPGARLEIIPGAGHLANLEQPEAFNKALSAFLATLK